MQCKYSTPLVFIFFSWSYFLMGQTISPMPPQPSNQGFYNFTTYAGSTPNDLTFWLFNDGHYGYGSAVQHHFIENENEVTVYYFDDKDDVPPPAAVFIPGGTGASYVSNPSIYQPVSQQTPISVGTSWNPTAGDHHFYIITFKNTAGAVINGYITVSLEGLISLRYAPKHNNTNWITNYVFSSNSNGNSGNPLQPITFIAEFKELGVGEQRNIFLKATVPPPGNSGNKLPYTAAMYQLAPNNGSDVLVGAANIGKHYVMKYPWDPNNKIANKKKVCQNSPAQEIKYRINFQNIGFNFADSIVITDILPSQLDASTVTLLPSSHAFTLSTIGNTVKFETTGAQLPGTQQNDPIVPTEDQTWGYVRFSVHTKECLTPDTFIDNEAVITFDEQPPIATGTSSIYITETGNCNNQYSQGYCSGNWNFSNNGGGINHSALAPIEVQTVPNPFNDELNVSINSLSAMLEGAIISNALGQIMISLEPQSAVEETFWATRVNTRNWPNGIYFLTIYSDDDAGATQRIIKR